MEYSIGTCLGCKKCLYCGNELSIQKKTRKSTPNLKKIDSNENNLVNNELINECEIIDLEGTVQTISFNLVVKPSNSAVLPSKWMEIEVLSLDDILVDVYRYVKKLIGDDEIMHSDYLITFKPEKNAGSGTQLIDMHDYKKFLSDYKKLSDRKKNMTIMVSLKKKEKKDKQSKRKRGLALDSEGSGSENVDVRKKKNAVPKLADFSEVIQQEGHVIRELREQYRCDQHDTCFIDNGRHTKLTAMHLQCWVKEIIRGTVDNTKMPNLPIFTQSNTAPFLDEFFAKLDGSDGTGEFANFKKTFEDEHISVSQIYDLTDAEFDQLGVKKIGWRKAIRAAARRYNR
ncbi:hypothetical protein GLOIN_2v1479040 [Rhizophagus clarus]|uniref:SAM domain-containing protein n=1 Tax=Rhizophagus clarus TaxID=94130 RepID=A0A8H3M8P1_9GLOM|nr:hypothetical protein GLOIN_2v1479040 [Rhizophagus clarus]